MNKSGPLYARARTADAHKVWLARQEEILNHVFDITFAIAPDMMIERCFAKPLGISDPGPYTSLGREIRQRYGWSRSENVTQQGGFFVSSRSALGVELKLKAKSSAVQIIKYAALFAWEEQHSGPRDALGLLYILETPADERHWRECGTLNGPAVDAKLFERIDIIALPKKVRQLVTENREALLSVQDRMSLSAITWAELEATCIEIRTNLGPAHAGGQSLIRLIDGFIAQIEIQVAERADRL